MTKDDKQFFRGLIGDLRTELKTEIGDLRTELKADIRANGVLIENLDTALCGVVDGVSDLNRHMKNVEADVVGIKEAICDYPIIRKMAQRHERLLTAK